MAGHGAKLPGKRECAITALLTARNLEEAAKTAGISVSTLTRWLREPEFDTAYRQVRWDSFSQSIARLHQLSGAAVATLAKVLVDPSANAAAKVRAANSILSNASKSIELEDLAVRIADLERAAEEVKEKRN